MLYLVVINKEVIIIDLLHKLKKMMIISFLEAWDLEDEL